MDKISRKRKVFGTIIFIFGLILGLLLGWIALIIGCLAYYSSYERDPDSLLTTFTLGIASGGLFGSFLNLGLHCLSSL